MPFAPGYKDHPSQGDWQAYRDAHIDPGRLLIYRTEGDELQLVRTAPMPICSMTDPVDVSRRSA